MSEHKTLIVKSMVKFLRKELSVGGHDADCCESLEVAVQCIESAYGVTDTDSDMDPVPNLDDIFRNLQLTGSSTTPEISKAADEHKNRGNSLMQVDNYQAALDEYTKAIELYDKNAVYYCNRAAAYSKLKQHNRAVEDSKMAIQLDPNYGKAYGRLGNAYTGLQKYADATVAYKKALELEPNNLSYIKNLMITQNLQQKETNPGGAASSQQGAPVEGGVSGTPNIDLSSVLRDVTHENIDNLFTNPQVVNLASQFLENPAICNLMQGFLQSNLLEPNNVSTIANAGYQIMDQLQTSNPEIADQLFQMVQNVREGNGGEPGAQPTSTDPPNPPQES